jgi:hypothetical protein
MVKLDEKTAMKYVLGAEDEATKNHKANENDIVTGYMPSMVDNKYCPVRSFIIYTQKPFILLLKNSGKLL